MKQPQGFTLLELTIVMASMAAILAASAMLIHFVLQFDGEVRQRMHTVVTMGRLGEQFRRDAHEAHGAPVVAADHRSAEFHLPGGTVVQWRIDDTHVIRTEKAPGAADREDAFELPQGATASLEMKPLGTARIAALRIESPGTSGPTLAIEALVSRNQGPAPKEAADTAKTAEKKAEKKP